MSDKSAEPKKRFFDKFAIFQKIKSIKHIELIICGIFFVILILIYLSSMKPKTNDNSINSDFNMEQYSKDMENKLSQVLSDISGAGKIQVMISFESGIEYVYATEKEEVTNTNQAGGGTNSKVTVTEKIVYVNVGGVSKPIIVKEIMPKVKGVIVVSGGASSISVRLELLKAVQAVLDVEQNKIEILVGK